MYYQIGDATYSYEVHGKGTPIVLLHGFTGSSLTWTPFITEYRHQFKLITIDLPGHGKTVSNTPRPMELLCSDLLKLVKHLKLTTFHLIGYSMGGRIALSFSMYYPENVLSLTLESASPGLRLRTERIERMKKDEKLAERIESDGIKAFVNAWEQISLFTTQKKLSIDTQTAIRKERLSQSEKGLAQSLRSIGTGKQPSWWGNLADFTGPVLLIVGEADKKFVNINKQMQKRFPSADLAVAKEAGHAVHIEQPETFGQLVTPFILDDKIFTSNI